MSNGVKIISILNIMRICFIVARNSSDSKVKPLLKFKETNQTVIQTICNNVIKSKLINEIIVITDNDNVKNHVSSFIKMYGIS